MQSARDQREAEKDPRVRYEKFLRTAKKPSGVSGKAQGGAQPSGSGSFGGKPKSYQGRRAGGGRRVVATTVPAWMQGPEEGEEEWT